MVSFHPAVPMRATVNTVPYIDVRNERVEKDILCVRDSSGHNHNCGIRITQHIVFVGFADAEVVVG